VHIWFERPAAGWCAPGRPFSDYENSVGTGQVHIWFERPAAGWCAPGRVGPVPDRLPGGC